MKPFILILSILAYTCTAYSQASDFIILKKKNNRTVKVYTDGSFLSARMNSGFDIHGMIIKIQNDSVFMTQQETRLVGTEFGSKIDTIFYRVAFDYRQILRFNYDEKDYYGRPTGFSVLSVPGIMMIGGAGYLFLESVNTLYRKESFTKDNKLVTLGIAAGIAAAGALWMNAKKREERKPTKLTVIYVKAGSIRFNPSEPE